MIEIAPFPQQKTDGSEQIGRSKIVVAIEDFFGRYEKRSRVAKEGYDTSISYRSEYYHFPLHLTTVLMKEEHFTTSFHKMKDHH
jgi:hypothetical protein